MFGYVIDMARVNSSTAFAVQEKCDPCKQDSFECCYTLLYQLVKPFIQLVKPFIQSRNLNGLNTLVKQKIELVIEKKAIGSGT